MPLTTVTESRENQQRSMWSTIVNSCEGYIYCYPTVYIIVLWHSTTEKGRYCVRGRKTTLQRAVNACLDLSWFVVDCLKEKIAYYKMIVYLSLSVFLAFLAVQCRCVSISNSPGSSGLNFVILGDWGGWPSPLYTTPLQKDVASAMGETATKINASFAVALGKGAYFLWGIIFRKL